MSGETTTDRRIRAIYPGTFDPLTNGHLDLVRRGSLMFDELVVSILRNTQKQTLFSLEERLEMLREVLKDVDNVVVDSFDGLLVNYARDTDSQVILRGLRAVSDFEYEFQMALMNRRMNGTLETMFMMPHESYSYLSSRLVKEVVSLGGDVHGLVPPEVEERLVRRLRS